MPKERPKRIEDSSEVPANLQYLAYRLVTTRDGEADYRQTMVNTQQALKALEDGNIPPEIIIPEPYVGEPTDADNN